MSVETIRKLRKQRYVTQGKQEWIIKPLEKINAVVYTSDNPELGSYTATMYLRTALKPRFAYRFRTALQRDDYVAKEIKSLVEREQRKADERKARTAGHTLKIGDVLSTSWGYDQTNVDFYKVVGLKGKASVELQEVNSVEVRSDRVIPGDTFVGKPFTKRVNAKYNSVRISSCQNATPQGKNEDGTWESSYRTPWGMGH